MPGPTLLYLDNAVLPFFFPNPDPQLHVRCYSFPQFNFGVFMLQDSNLIVPCFLCDGKEGRKEADWTGGVSEEKKKLMETEI